jgi:hypothetical protein
VPDLFDGMMLFGVGLIVGGAGLLASALAGVSRSRSRHRRPAWRHLDQNRPEFEGEQPTIRRSALLAETVLLKHIPTRGPKPRIPSPPPPVPYPPKR